MPSNNRKDDRMTDTNLEQPQFALGNQSLDNPVDYQQMVSDVPLKPKASTINAQVRPTRGSRMQIMHRTTVFAKHHLNLPHNDQFTRCSSMYRFIRSAAQNFQRQDGNNAFFEVWPGLVMQPPSEHIPDTSVLRRDYEKYSKRIAHYYVHYTEGCLALMGALANLCALSKYNGNDVLKAIASDVRLSRLNTMTNLYSRFPKPLGTEAYILDNTKYAVGKTNYGADVLSIPEWIVDIWGNRGWHTIPLSQLFTNKGGQSNNNGNIAFLDNESPSTHEANRAYKLIDNILKTIREYGYDTDSETVDDWFRPMHPPVTNGGRFSFSQKDSKKTFQFAANLDSFMANLEIAERSNDLLPFNCSDIITKLAWANYKFWETYMIDNFSDMMDPNSDKYVFALTQLGIIEKSRTFKDCYTAIASNKNVTMNSLLDAMKFKKGNAPTTATIVKWAPLYGGARGNNQNPYSDSNFADNFEKYPVELTNAAMALYEDKENIRLNPITFAHAAEVTLTEEISNPLIPFAINALPTSGNEFTTYNDNHGSFVPSPIGKAGVICDLAMAVTSNPEESVVGFSGVTEDFALNFVDSCKPVVFEEDPTSYRVLVQPLIDNTDPYQCGFNLFIPANNMSQSDTERFYRNQARYPYMPSEYKLGDSNYFNVVKIGDKYLPFHPGYYDVIAKLGSVEVFIGMGIQNHPIQSAQLKTSMNPLYTVRIVSDDISSDDEGKQLKQYLSNFMSRFKQGNGQTLALLNQILLTASYDLSDNDLNSAMVKLKEIIVADQPLTGKNVFLYGENTFAIECGSVQIATETQEFADNANVDTFHLEQDTVNSRSVEFVFTNVDPDDVDYTLNDAKRKSMFNNVDYAVDSIMPFLSYIKFNPVYLSADGTSQVVSDHAFKELDFINSSESLRSMLATVTVQFSGIGKTTPFWSMIGQGEARKYAVSFTLKETVAVPENNVMVEPRVERTTGKTAPAFAQHSTGASSTLSQDMSNQRSYSGESSKGGKHLRGKRGSVGQRSHTKGKQSRNQSGTEESRLRDGDVNPLNDGIRSASKYAKKNEGSDYDMSSAQTDSKVDKLSTQVKNAYNVGLGSN